VNHSLSTDQLRTLAREGARVRLQELRAEIAALESLVREGGGAAGRAGRPARGGRRGRGQLSVAGRAAIAAGQKARWQRVKAAKNGSQASGDTPAPAAPRSRPKPSTMSAAARKAVSERMRKYWAARRKQGANTPTRAASSRR
jgi:hypothetical protein